VACATASGRCEVDGQATIGNLLVPLGPAWLGLQGPVWSWKDRQFRDARVALALGWSYERRPREVSPGAQAPPTWSPPPAEEVRAYRLRRTTSLVFLAATAGSTAQNQTVGVGFQLLVDRDRWNRRAGLSPGLTLQLDGGTLEGVRARAATLAPLGRIYVVPDLLSLEVVPAFVRVATLTGDRWTVDVAGRLGFSVALGRVEVRVDSPPLSYVSRGRWHALPFSVALGLLL
jgi:hypothetical protein